MRAASLREAPRKRSNLSPTPIELSGMRQQQAVRLKRAAHRMSDQQTDMITVVQFPPHKLRLTETELCGWIGQAAPGDALEYYRGFLAMDTFSQAKRLTERERAELVRLARRAWCASEQKLIHLVQRRHGADDYSYLAIARPKPASASLSSLLLAEVA
jgi:hypothetical protein